MLPLMLHHRAGWLGIAVSVGAITIKGFVIPAMLNRALRAAKIDREVEPLLSFVPSLLLGAGATIGAIALSGALPLRPEHANSLLLPGSFATVVCGFLLLVGRAKAISQVCGYLVLENGIFLFGLLLIGSTPLVVEAGILLDLKDRYARRKAAQTLAVLARPVATTSTVTAPPWCWAPRRAACGWRRAGPGRWP